MRKYYSLVAAALLLGCSDDGSKTTAPQLSGAVVGVASFDKKGNGNSDQGNSAKKKDDDDHDNGNHNGQRLAVTLLKGENEVPSHDTHANGRVSVKLSSDGLSMNYTLVVNDISNVTQAHFHMAAAGVNGPIVIWLFPNSKSTAALPGGGGPIEKLVISGTFTAADFRGVLAGKTMADLVAAIAAGNIYGNVHTDDGVAPGNTGPGDFPGGEIRGQMADTKK